MASNRPLRAPTPEPTHPADEAGEIARLAADGVDRAYELGSGAVLAGLVRRIAPGVEVTTIGEPHEVDAFVAGGRP